MSWGEPRGSSTIEVTRDWLVYVDSVTSVVAHRGLDDESRNDLLAISGHARDLTHPGAARAADPERASTATPHAVEEVPGSVDSPSPTNR